MKNNMIKYLASAALAVGIVGTVQAIPITGSIGFTGTYTSDATTPGDLTTALHMTIAPGAVSVTPGSGTGSFLTAGGVPLGFASPVGVNADLLTPMIGQLWSVKVGAITYTFTVTSESESLKTAAQINLIGNGTISDGVPADATSGTWQLGFGVSGTPPLASFTFQSTSAAGVPDGGTTAMLLGAALSGLAMLRRKLA
jgi:hypothetical protein